MKSSWLTGTAEHLALVWTEAPHPVDDNKETVHLGTTGHMRQGARCWNLGVGTEPRAYLLSSAGRASLCLPQGSVGQAG